MTISEQLKNAKALCEKISPGPWSYNSIGPIVNDQKRNLVCATDSMSYFSIVNAEFIAQSRTLMPKLITALEVAIEELTDQSEPGEQHDRLYACTSNAQHALAQIDQILRGEADEK